MPQSRIYNPFVGSGGGGGGEANTGANVGTGQGVFKNKTGVILNFKTITAGSGITLTPSTDELQISSSGGATERVEQRTVTGPEAAAESLTLSFTPLDATKVKVYPVGGVRQQYGVDFTVSGTTLSWVGLGLSGLVAAGDVLIIDYLS